MKRRNATNMTIGFSSVHSDCCVFSYSSPFASIYYTSWPALFIFIFAPGVFLYSHRLEWLPPETRLDFLRTFLSFSTRSLSSYSLRFFSVLYRLVSHHHKYPLESPENHSPFSSTLSPSPSFSLLLFSSYFFRFTSTLFVSLTVFTLLTSFLSRPVSYSLGFCSLPTSYTLLMYSVSGSLFPSAAFPSAAFVTSPDKLPRDSADVSQVLSWRGTECCKILPHPLPRE